VRTARHKVKGGEEVQPLNIQCVWRTKSESEKKSGSGP
jgi:hypothetical protein